MTTEAIATRFSYILPSPGVESDLVIMIALARNRCFILIIWVHWLIFDAGTTHLLHFVADGSAANRPLPIMIIISTTPSPMSVVSMLFIRPCCARSSVKAYHGSIIGIIDEFKRTWSKIAIIHTSQIRVGSHLTSKLSQHFFFF